MRPLPFLAHARASTHDNAAHCRLPATTLLVLLSVSCGAGELADKGAAKNADRGGDAVSPAKDANKGGAGVPQGLALKDDEFVVIGSLGRRGVPSCTRQEPYEPQWANITWRVGDVLLTPPAGVDPSTVTKNRVVVARGIAPKAAAAKTETADPEELNAGDGRSPANCMPMQMRDDWISTPDGIVVRRGGLAPVAAIEASSLSEWKGISFTASDDGTTGTVKLTDDMGRAAIGLEITAHYEGCYGKPGSTSQRAVVDLLANASVESTFPLYVDDDAKALGATDSDAASGGRIYRLSTLQVSGGEAPIHYAVDVSTAALGVPVECKERGAKTKASPK